MGNTGLENFDTSITNEKAVETMIPDEVMVKIKSDGDVYCQM